MKLKINRSELSGLIEVSKDRGEVGRFPDGIPIPEFIQATDIPDTRTRRYRETLEYLRGLPEEKLADVFSLMEYGREKTRGYKNVRLRKGVALMPEYFAGKKQLSEWLSIALEHNGGAVSDV